MPIKSNRYYNDPTIGAAFEGLASLFAPPSAQDTYAYARAKAESEEAERAAEAFRQMTAEGVSPDEVDRYGGAIGRFNPTQSYQALQMGDDTLRHGQDIESGDRRYNTDKSSLASMYGHDRSYQSSVENSVRETAGAYERQKLSELGGLFGPVAEGAVRPEIPGNIASQFGVEGPIAPAEGRQKPMTTDEFTASTLAALRAGGHLKDQDFIDRFKGDTPVENIVGPDGKPVVVARPDAVGREPYFNPGAQAAPQTPN